MKIDWKGLYQGRIDQINLDIRVAVNQKKWTLKAKLEAEKKIMMDHIEKLE